MSSHETEDASPLQKLEKLLTEGTQEELVAFLTQLQAKKKLIETQLSGNKVDQVEHRQRLIEAGVHPQQAKMEAEALAQPGWRHRAASVLRGVDTKIVRVRARIAALNSTRKLVTATVIEGATAEEVAGRIQWLVDEGEADYILSAFPFAGKVVLIYRKRP